MQQWVAVGLLAKMSPEEECTLCFEFEEGSGLQYREKCCEMVVQDNGKQKRAQRFSLEICN